VAAYRGHLSNLRKKTGEKKRTKKEKQQEGPRYNETDSPIPGGKNPSYSKNCRGR